MEQPDIKTGARVRIYEDDEWFNEGTTISVDKGLVEVDFSDWIQVWPSSELKISYEGYSEYFSPLTVGVVTKQFYRRVV